jgi:replication factor A2
MIFEEPESLSIEQGLHIDQVAQRMVGYSRQQVKEAIEFLVNEGFVYSTIDDDHYKSTNG